jgi:serine/threonine-protein kinase HipA
LDAFSQWSAMGKQWGVEAEDRKRVTAGHRLYLAK